MQDSKEKAKVSDVVDNLSNTVIAPEVSETLTKITSNNNLPIVEEPFQEVISPQPDSFEPIISPPVERAEMKHRMTLISNIFLTEILRKQQTSSHDEPQLKV